MHSLDCDSSASCPFPFSNTAGGWKGMLCNVLKQPYNVPQGNKEAQQTLFKCRPLAFSCPCLNCSTGPPLPGVMHQFGACDCCGSWVHCRSLILWYRSKTFFSVCFFYMELAFFFLCVFRGGDFRGSAFPTEWCFFCH